VPGPDAGPFSTPRNTVLFLPPETLAAVVKSGGDGQGVDVAGQPAQGKGSVSPLQGGGLQFIPKFKATGQSSFSVKDGSGGASVPITVDVLGERRGGGFAGSNAGLQAEVLGRKGAQHVHNHTHAVCCVNTALFI
jgi:hypothetical protein